MNVLGYEMNGGVRKALTTAVITASTGFAGYLLHNIAKVEPLAVKTNAIEEKLDMQIDASRGYRDDQKEWNRLFLSHQESTETKIDAVLRAVREKP